MNIVMYLVGAALLYYYWTSMKIPFEGRPRVIMEHGGLVLAAGISFVILGYVT